MKVVSRPPKAKANKTNSSYKLVIKFLPGFDTGNKPLGWKAEDGNPLRYFYADTLKRAYAMVEKYKLRIDLAEIYNLQKPGNPREARYNTDNQWNNPA